MTFEEFLVKHKIAPEKFQAQKPELFRKLQEEFQFLGEKPFYQRKKSHINKWRLEFKRDA